MIEWNIHEVAGKKDTQHRPEKADNKKESEEEKQEEGEEDKRRVIRSWSEVEEGVEADELIGVRGTIFGSSGVILNAAVFCIN